MPRDSNGHAIIPEARNDENLIIIQFHKAVAQFHNRLVDHVRSQGVRPEWVFETARRLDPLALPVGRDPRLPAPLRRRRARRADRHGLQGGRRASRR